jgi:hypothetical protein
MKIRISNKVSCHIMASKRLLLSIATATIAGGVDAGFGGMAHSAPITVLYNGTVYTLDTELLRARNDHRLQWSYGLQGKLLVWQCTAGQRSFGGDKEFAWPT